MIEAMRCGFADTLSCNGDPDFTEVPIRELLSEEHASEWADRIDRARRTDYGKAGILSQRPDARVHGGDDTVYFAVTDRYGNACSFINSNFMGFGTGIVPRGCSFSLQNRGRGFVLDAQHPNVLAPRKRPYHTIIPGMITREDHGAFHAAFGVMGGMMQPQGHLQVVQALLEDGRDPQSALDRLRFQLADGDPDGAVLLEETSGAPADRPMDRDTERDGLARELGERGHEVRPVRGRRRAAFGLGQIILRDGNGIEWGGSDPRGDGAAGAPIP
jgi:gamma-glutamyltranspeptidase/glutathione hydrolase